MGFRILLLFTLFSLNYFCISATFCSYTYDSRCSSDQICCNNQCVYGSDCIGQYCYFDSDCSYGEVCCDNTCSNDCINNVGVIIGTVFSILFFIVLICVIVFCCRRRRLQSVQRPILGQRVITTTTTTTRNNYRQVPNYPQQGPYQGQPPYGYQQGYVQPPQYPGYGATNPIAGTYQSGNNAPPPMAAAQPPPYEEAPAVVTLEKGNTQKNNYEKASAPPM